MASFAITDKDMKDMSDEQRGAIFDALVAGGWADGKVSDAERKRFEEEVVKIPWAQSEADLIAMINASSAKVAGLKDRDEASAFIKAVAAKLPSLELREKVLHVMILIMWSDKKLETAEQGVIAAFAEAFGVTQERFKEIGASVLKKS
jgi:uncharacterized tellurite resistance protein B-like protein